ncbi:MAG: EamA family transporter [Verrucomicrobiaceae bacterium]|nr:EamA family transporter [Verrucomicrobiaceae bacterium]
MPASRGGLLFVFLTVLLTVLGQLLVKTGMSRVGAAPSEPGALPWFLFKALFHPANFFGLACAFLAAFSWMAALTRVELSFAYPFTSLSIVLVMALSSWLFGEKVVAQQWVGVAVVCLGLWIASRGAA